MILQIHFWKLELRDMSIINKYILNLVCRILIVSEIRKECDD